MVAPAVVTRTTASPRVDRSSADRLDTRTMCTAVAMRTPASAASGIRPTKGAATSTATSRTAACVRAASRDLAPDLTLTAVRAIAAVAGTPPKSGTTRLANP